MSDARISDDLLDNIPASLGRGRGQYEWTYEEAEIWMLALVAEVRRLRERIPELEQEVARLHGVAIGERKYAEMCEAHAERVEAAARELVAAEDAYGKEGGAGQALRIEAAADRARAALTGAPVKGDGEHPRRVLIGSSRAAADWCRENRVSLREVLVVQRFEQLLGLRGPLHEVHLHDAIELPDLVAIDHRLRIIEAQAAASAEEER